MTRGTVYSYIEHMIEDLQKRLVKDGRIEFVVRVRPHSAATQLTSVMEDGSLKIDVAAPAEDGRGNVMLVKFLGEQFVVPASSVKILSGKTARLKLVRIVFS